MADSDVNTHSCDICCEPSKLKDLLGAPCGCSLCSNCLYTIFRLATRDETLYPPSCCHRPLPIHKSFRHLPKATVHEFKLRWPELATKDKKYCHKSTCSAFIAPQHIHNFEGYCQKCRSKTCVKCSSAAHFGPCTFEGDADLLETAKEERWQKCPGCQHLVERSEGCPDMHCRCGTNFCYGCGKLSLECKCTTMADEIEDERRLAAGWENVDYTQEPDMIAEELAEATNARQVETDPRWLEVWETARQLERRSHLTESHNEYELLQGNREYECGVCDGVYRGWINQCADCGIFTCNRCRVRSRR
ncbi:hypothetical protein LTR17_021964 [Elasticomyces elasticus]|nr:hypothetical protein LTR17_021964 [Elasticomyces elasticus]